ncbi:hypothetical protein ABN702_17245 [Bacillus haimaensis]|uniref:hypothetical protein n=1 Tax=Bacillus haimaensis TaxID=3160967 RepID=UPI003AA97887
MSKQGKVKKEQTREQIEKQDNNNNNMEFGNEYTIGNTASQSQKKSGTQANKK